MDPRDSSPEVFSLSAARNGLRPEQARKIFAAVVGRGNFRVSSWTDAGIISKHMASQFVDLPQLTLIHSVTSPVDRFTKLAFSTGDNLTIETVLIPLLKPNCFTVCLSSQVGCPMACAFCATARMPKRRNLESWEIVDQFIQAREIAHRRGGRVTGAVFMGMGEPFLNYDRVINAANILRFPVNGSIRGKAITISTVGLVPEIDRFTSEVWPFRLAISIGAATDEKRAMLVPVAARLKISAVMEAARRHALARKDRVMISYVCIGGVNVSEEDAAQLGRLIGDTPVRLDLIDVIDSTGRFSPPSDSQLTAFRDALSKYVRQPVVRRYSGGKDIQAACGTLAGQLALLR